MKIEKKTWPEYFQLILDGKKNYELRIADFQCSEGDVLVLREWDPSIKKYTGRVIEKEVGYVGKLGDMSFWKKEDLENHGLQCISLKDSQHISREIFEKEIAMCKKHYQKKQHCAWGKCENCGVLPLLVKLRENKLIESKEELENLKEKILKY